MDDPIRRLTHIPRLDLWNKDYLSLDQYFKVIIIPYLHFDIIIVPHEFHTPRDELHVSLWVLRRGHVDGALLGVERVVGEVEPAAEPVNRETDEYQRVLGTPGMSRDLMIYANFEHNTKVYIA